MEGPALPSRQGIASKTRPLADSTLPVNLPADLFVTLANAAGMPGPEKLTLILADQRPDGWRAQP